MKIEITGKRCASCNKYMQYYQLVGNKVDAVDRGFCKARQCVTRPWEKCKNYAEMSSIGFPRSGSLLIKV